MLFKFQLPQSHNNHKRPPKHMQGPKKHSIPHVALDGTVSELESYRQMITNEQFVPYLIESLSPDLPFDKQWMVQLQDVYRNDKKQMKMPLVGYINIVVGSARCGKFAYVFYRKQQESKDNNLRLITVDCQFSSTPYGFVSELVQQFAYHLEKSTTKGKKKQSSIKDTEIMSKSMIISDGINLKSLDNPILQRQDLKFIIVIKNCDVLVEKKKQIILYNLLEWIKGDVKNQIGFALLTRRLDFIERLEKRIKSRMSYKMIFLVGVRDEKIIKQAILKRFDYALSKTQDHNIVVPGRKFLKYFEQSHVIEALLKQEQTMRCPKQIQFFLQLFKLILALQFDGQKPIMPKDQKAFDIMMSNGYKLAKQHMPPYAERQKLMLYNMNFPEFIAMGIIRKMLMDEKPRICLKQMMKQLAIFKQTFYSSSGNSFDFPHKCFERALKNLKKIRVLDLNNEKDMDNADIISFMGPDQIKQAIEERKDLPTYVTNLLS